MKTFRIVVSYGSASIRREVMDGKTYIVVPTVILKEGVHHGSAGPIYHGPVEMQKYVEAWNGRPIPVYHPEDQQGNPTTCNTPELLQTQTVGQVFNAIYMADPPRIVAEFWFDEAKVGSHTPTILNRILNGSPMNVSVGVFHDIIPQEGTWNGEHYEAIAVNYRPDHVALLPDTQGACSLEDGCGTMRVNQGGSVKKKLREKAIESVLSYVVDKDNTKATELIATLEQTLGVDINTLEKPEKPQVFTFLDAFGHNLTTNEASYQQINRNLSMWVDALDQSNIGLYHVLEAVYDSYFIYRKIRESNGSRTASYLKRSYTSDENGSVTIAEEVTEVIQKMEWIEKPNDNSKPKNNSEGGNQNMKKTCCEERVKALIANQKTPFTEADTEYLSGLSEERLVIMEETFQEDEKPQAGQGTSTDAPKANAADPNPNPNAPDSLAAYLQTLPGEIRESVEIGLATHKQQKQMLVQSLIKNQNNQFSEEELNAMNVPTLQKMHKLGVTYDYSGRGGGQLVVDSADDGIPVLDDPDFTLQQ